MRVRTWRRLVAAVVLTLTLGAGCGTQTAEDPEDLAPPSQLDSPAEAESQTTDDDTGDPNEMDPEDKLPPEPSVP